MNSDTQDNVVPKSSSIDANATLATIVEECDICLLPFNNKTTIVPCMHSYCYDCLKEWQHNPMVHWIPSKCCTCRREILELRHSFTPTGDFQTEYIAATPSNYSITHERDVAVQWELTVGDEGDEDDEDEEDDEDDEHNEHDEQDEHDEPDEDDVEVDLDGRTSPSMVETVEDADIRPQGIQPDGLSDGTPLLAGEFQERTRMGLYDILDDWQRTLSLTRKPPADPDLDGDLQDAVEATTVAGARGKITRLWQASLHELASRAAPDMSSVQDSMYIWGLIERLLVFRQEFESESNQERRPFHMQECRCRVALLFDMTEKTLEYYRPSVGTFSATVPTMGLYAYIQEDLDRLYVEIARACGEHRVSLQILRRRDLFSIINQIGHSVDAI